MQELTPFTFIHSSNSLHFLLSLNYDTRNYFGYILGKGTVNQCASVGNMVSCGIPRNNEVCGKIEATSLIIDELSPPWVLARVLQTL